MMPRRVLVAVEPRVLADALAVLLRAAGDDVVVVEPGEMAEAGAFDVAISTAATPDGPALAPVTLVLPDALGNAGPAWVLSPEGDRVIDLRDEAEVVAALDHHAPRPRTAG